MAKVRKLTKAAMTAVLPRRTFMMSGNGPGISLTFDDGPHPELTPQVLDNLAAAGARGTFFVVGEKAERHPEIIRRIVDEGHELGNHTWTHSQPSETSAAVFAEEIVRTRTLLQDLTGIDCRLVRPPKGSLSASKLWAMMKMRQTVVLWNVDPRDYRMESWSQMEDWCRGYQPGRGDIVLLHDDRPYAVTATALAGVLPQFGGVSFRVVSDWLGAASGRPELVSSR